MPLSPDVAVMLSPSAVYQRLAAERATDNRLALALRRPMFVALLVATALAISSTGRITAGLLVSLGLCWSFATVIQGAAAIAIIRPSRERTVSVARAFDLLFLAHGPWSFWLLGLAAWAAVGAEIPRVAISTILIPAAWTGAIVFVFCRTVLNAAPRAAVTKTCLHQVAIWMVAGAYFSAATQVWPRILGILGR